MLPGPNSMDFLAGYGSDSEKDEATYEEQQLTRPQRQINTAARHTVRTHREAAPVQLFFELLRKKLDRGALPSVRLCCSGAAQALDGGHTTCVKSIHVRDCQAQCFHIPARLAHSLQHMELAVKHAAGWWHVQQVAAYLPELVSIRFYGSAAWPPAFSDCRPANMAATRPGASQDSTAVAKVQALSFSGKLTSLQGLQALAPRLQHLYCDVLQLSSGDSRSLPYVTTLGAFNVANMDTIRSTFPNLSKTYQFNNKTYGRDGNARHANSAASTRSLWPFIQGVPSAAMRAVPGDKEWLLRLAIIPRRAAQLRDLQVLVGHGMQPRIVDRSLRKLSSVHSLALSFNDDVFSGNPAVVSLLEDLRKLPRLERLVLPATLLCKCCYDSAQQPLLQLIHPPAAACGSNGSPSSSSSGSSSSTSQHLKELLFMSRRRGAASELGVGNICKHLVGVDLDAVVAELVVAAAAQPGSSAPGGPSQLRVSHVAAPRDLSAIGKSPGGCSEGTHDAGAEATWGCLGPRAWYV